MKPLLLAVQAHLVNICIDLHIIQEIDVSGLEVTMLAADDSINSLSRLQTHTIWPTIDCSSDC